MASKTAKRTTSKTPDISIVVPVMNEEGNIKPLISASLMRSKDGRLKLFMLMTPVQTIPLLNWLK